MPHAGRVVDSLTVLTCDRGKVAGKIWHAGEDKPRGHNAGWRFTVEERRFESFNGLAEILAEIEQDNTKLVIRGYPAGEWRRRPSWPYWELRVHPSAVFSSCVRSSGTSN